MTMSTQRHVSITVGIMIASYILSIATSNLSTVLSLVGATGSTTICYILPGLFYVKFRENSDPSGTPWDAKKTWAFVLAVMGVLIMSTSLTSQLIGLFYGSSNPGASH
jgi:amino acid permease